MTGFQGRASGGRKNPYYIRRDGLLVAFTLQLAKPTAEEINFFNDNFGTPSTARISVMRRGDTRKKRLNHRLISQSDRFELDRYFGSRPTFVFDEPIPVKKGNWIAITVPTWAPLLSTNLARTNWWRSSRPKGSCEPPRSLRQFALEDLRDVDRVRLHLPRRAAALHGHVRAEQPRDERTRRVATKPFNPPSIAVASTR